MDKLFEGVLFKSELKGFTSGGAVDHGELSGLTDDDHAQYLRKDGSRALTANWDAGAFEIRAQTLESDVATGTAPLTIASTTLVSNLNADLLDSQQGSYYLDSDNFTGTEWTDLTDSGETTLHIHDTRYYTETEIDTTLTGYLPLTAGSTKPLTGDLYVDGGGVYISDGGISDYGSIVYGSGGNSFSFTNSVAAGNFTQYFMPRPSATGIAEIDFFRLTDTTGEKRTIWRVGTNSANIYHYIVNDVANFGSYSAGNYVQVRPEGVYLVGTATMWDDLRFPALTAKVGGVNDPSWGQLKDNGSGSTGVYIYFFDKNTEQELFFVAQMPHSWAEGTDIEAHVHWTPASTAPGAGTDVCWGLEYTWANINGTYGNTAIIYGDEQSNGATETITADKHYLTELGTISGSGKTISSCLVCRVFRDAGSTGGTDDYDDDAGMIEVDFHYQINSFGSDDEYVKGP
jgi:hypothetical protein